MTITPCRDLRRRYPTEWGLFLFLFIIAATPLALHLHQEQIRMVRGNKEARKRPTESNGTPAMDLGLGTDHVRRYRVLFCFVFVYYIIRDDVKLSQLVGARDC